LLGKEIQRNAAIFYNEIKNRLISSEHSVPEFIEGYWYYIKRDADRPFDVYCRKKGSLDAPEEVHSIIRFDYCQNVTNFPLRLGIS